ncbi:MAG: acyl-ACP--UDP-N-acetylglucosamine O-acyltransferase [Gammaproteobacteria bacterium]|nr:acyl-ACP--UDP-N-acetylglucosamine O-acyltransferase [Gammaproteobacteria bacterium]
MKVHASAAVSKDADISPDAEIGPFCVIEGRVSIGAGTVVESHARIGSRFGSVTIGERNFIQNGAVLGSPPQDLGYDSGYYSSLAIGDDNRIGEYVTVSLGTEKGGGVTRIGSGNFLMAYVHVGHDCELGNDIVITNLSQLAGHVTIEDHALLSGHTGVTQFVRLGAYSFLVGGSYANKDVPPFTIAEGYWATLRATNRVGLKRAGFEPAERRNVDQAVRILLDGSTTVAAALERIRGECAPSPQIERLVSFVESSQRGIARR